MRLLIAGDFCPQHRATTFFKNNGFEPLLSEVKKITDEADYSILNLECPIVDSVDSPILKQGPNLSSDESALDAIHFMGFKAVALANNHIKDQGERGVISTINKLSKRGIDYVGIGCDSIQSRAILFKTIKGLRFAIINCCEHEFSLASDDSAGANCLNPIAQYYDILESRKKADKVIVIVHGGHEHYQLPSPRMVETYRFFVDCGADAVLNIHQHCYSGYEVYNNSPIFYGLGNFYFDNPNHTKGDKWNYGYMVSLDFDGDDTSFCIHPYSQCMESPSIHMLNDTAFADKINELNDILSDPVRLKEKTDEYYDKEMGLVEYMITPYQNRILRGLVKHRIIPSPFVKQWLLKLYDYILCESHRDKVENFLSSKLNMK